MLHPQVVIDIPDILRYILQFLAGQWLAIGLCPFFLDLDICQLRISCSDRYVSVGADTAASRSGLIACDIHFDLI